MADTSHLQGLDPYAILDSEADRIDRFLSSIPDGDPAWEAPTRCTAWNRRELLAHLAAGEEYHHACFDDALESFFGRFAAAGATDLDGFNAVGVQEREGRAPSELLAEWRDADARTRRLFRERGDGEMMTSVGPYPARWQAFHIALELATHADDLGTPVSSEEAAGRLDWLTRCSRFTLSEAKPDLVVRSDGPGTTTVESGDRQISLDDEAFVAAVAARLPADADVDAETRSLLSTMP